MQDFVTKTLEEMFDPWPLKPEISITEEDERLFVNIKTGKDTDFHQFNGQPVVALQYLLRLITKKQFPEENIQIVLDVGDFREKQKDNIKSLVYESALRVKASGASLHLRPMSAFERRLVHTEVAETDGVESESMGVGRDRHVVIKLKSL
ncbi:MAG: R3H domain-containing nucleic acid-binding protein [Patescibacteria group bacterium]|nr:R3H domain-containing nucleic acid-binding protein [Patescibacteria group bacterium]